MARNSKHDVKKQTQQEVLQNKAAKALLRWLDDSSYRDFDCDFEVDNQLASLAYNAGYNAFRAEAMRVVADFVFGMDEDEDDPYFYQKCDECDED